MDTAHKYSQVIFAALFAPGLVSVALVIALSRARKRFPAISRWVAVALFGIGLLFIAGALPAWQILLPEPCHYYFTKPMGLCWMEPSAIFSLGLFAGLLGALTALLLMKIWRVMVRMRS
ncbi:hypothetical protein [Pseudomonas sp. ADAK13]|uniref:hypothetical protein n=1 Tax=Pseudomonas sp. ADAK13 TaxID=2730847 RepID=UPI001463D9EA|nr:hypothetical protein [Pseudomonas sp. ADAK13]QJI38235.1 hypothetical protein HKK54_28825 [Pseudomonas sp. ADAK13]